MKTQRELRLRVFHTRHIENLAFRHALTKGLALSGESLSVTSLSRNVASVNQTILLSNNFISSQRQIHRVELSIVSWSQHYEEKMLRLTGGGSTPREVGNIPTQVERFI